MTIRLTSSHGSWALPNGATVFGRSKSCDICLLDSRLSRRHATFHVQHSRIEIEDLGSTNGLLVNGIRLHGRRELAQGDQIIIGPCVITVIIDPTMRPSEILRALTPGQGIERPTAASDVTDVMNPVLAPEVAHSSLARRIDPAIAAATGDSGQRDSQGPNERSAPAPDRPLAKSKRNTTETHKPADLVMTSEGALDAANHAAHDLAATVADDPPLFSPMAAKAAPPAAPTQPVAPIQRPPSAVPIQRPPSAPAAAWPVATTTVTPSGRRLLAGTLDSVQAGAIACALAVLPLVAGYVLALRAAGAVLRDGLPRLSYTGVDPASATAIAGSLLHPGGLQRAVAIAGELQQHYERLPTMLLFAGVTGAALAFALTHLIASVVATVLHGGPVWHRRLGLVIVDPRTGAWPSWGRALARWTLLLGLWPLAPITALLGRRGLHDRLSGCAVRTMLR